MCFVWWTGIAIYAAGLMVKQFYLKLLVQDVGKWTVLHFVKLQVWLHTLRLADC